MTSLESVASCPVCGSHQFNNFIATSDFSVTNEPFGIVKCGSCGLGITTPRPSRESMDKYYDSRGYISHSGGTGTIADRAYKTVRAYSTQQKLKLISRFQAVGSILDFGCGTGHFLHSAKAQGWKSTGVEPSEIARKNINPGLSVYPDLTDVNGPFDVITLWHVLEHVHDLNDTLMQLHQRLRPGGTIFIAVPNHESFDASYYGKYWAGYDVPRHLWHFTRPSLTTLLSSHHLTLLAIRPMKFDAYYVSLLSESYKRPGSGFINAVRGFSSGLASNIKAGADNYSSLIYIGRS